MSEELVANRGHYRDIFNFFAKNGKISKKELLDMFQMVQLHPTHEDLGKYMQIVFESRQTASFEDFLKLFRMKCSSNEYSKDEILKGFILLSDSSRKLHISKVEELITAHVDDQREVKFLMEHMRTFMDGQGYVDYEYFVNHSF